mgnify:CR=1 FL=1
MTWTGIIIFTIVICVVAGVGEYRAQHELPFTDPTPATSEDDTAAYHGQERAV